MSVAVVFDERVILIRTVPLAETKTSTFLSNLLWVEKTLSKFFKASKAFLRLLYSYVCCLDAVLIAWFKGSPPLINILARFAAQVNIILGSKVI